MSVSGYVSQKPHIHTVPHFLYMLPVAIAWLSSGNIAYFCNLYFVGDVICFCIIARHRQCWKWLALGQVLGG